MTNFDCVFAQGKAAGVREGLERAKLYAECMVPKVDDTGNGDEYRRGQKRGASDCVFAIGRALASPAPESDSIAAELTALRETCERYEAALREIESRVLRGDGAVAFEGAKRVARDALAKAGKGGGK